MNEITKDILAELSPELAIIVYKYEDKYYLERRDIVEGRMRAGIPLTEKCITEIIDTISSEESNFPHGVVPANMLYADGSCGREKYIWYRSPEKRSLFFSKEANIPDGEMWVPGLIYVVSGNVLSVYAFKGKTPKDRLFMAPFFNIYDGGSVCLGSAKVDNPNDLTYQNIILYWEKMFWASEFAHLLGSNPVKNNLTTIIKQCIATGSRFPESELRPEKTKLKDLIR